MKDTAHSYARQHTIPVGLMLLRLSIVHCDRQHIYCCCRLVGAMSSTGCIARSAGEQWRLYLSEAAGTTIVGVIAIVASISAAPTPLSFTERDPSLSFQLVEPETVPLSMLIGISVGVPLSVIAFMHTFNIRRSNNGDKTFRSICISFAWILLGFAQCLCVVFAITNSIKIAVGRQVGAVTQHCSFTSDIACTAR